MEVFATLVYQRMYDSFFYKKSPVIQMSFHIYLNSHFTVKVLFGVCISITRKLPKDSGCLSENLLNLLSLQGGKISYGLVFMIFFKMALDITILVSL